jgi:hypothetical protein
MATSMVKNRELPEPTMYSVCKQVGMDFILPLMRSPSKSKCEEYIQRHGYLVVSEFNGRFYVM